jgi:hypothetical protein
MKIFMMWVAMENSFTHLKGRKPTKRDPMYLGVGNRKMNLFVKNKAYVI